MLNQLLMIANLKKQKGLTTVEYAVAGALIAAAVIAAFLLLGTNVGTVVNTIAGQVQVK